MLLDRLWHVDCSLELVPGRCNGRDCGVGGNGSCGELDCRVAVNDGEMSFDE